MTLTAACGPATSGGGQTQAPPRPQATVHVLEQIGSPNAAATVAPVSGTRVEPKGRLVYAYSTTLPPAWLDPQEDPSQVTPYLVPYAVHDALVKHLPGHPLAPSLAESYEVAPDYKSATFRLRPGIKFHDGSPVAWTEFDDDRVRGGDEFRD